MASPEAAAPALDPSASRATAASARETNTSIRRSYRCGRCPRWRVRPDPDAASSRSRRPKGGRRPATLLYDSDGGAPFERAAETRDGITVWMRASPDPACAVKEVLAEARFGDVPVAAFWRAVGDVHRYDEFVPFVKRSDVIRTCDRLGAPGAARAAEHTGVWLDGAKVCSGAQSNHFPPQNRRPASARGDARRAF